LSSSTLTTQDVLEWALGVGGWYKTITDAKGGGPSPPFYQSFENANVLPALGWTDELAQYHALMFGMQVTAIELDAYAYRRFFSHIDSITDDHTSSRRRTSVHPHTQNRR
jgi:hypothetical protein